MTGEVTGTLDVVNVDGTTSTYQWNGNVEDRAAARAAFDAVAASGGILATVVEDERTATHVRSFDEIETVERERGTVTARVSRQVVGG